MKPENRARIVALGLMGALGMGGCEGAPDDAAVPPPPAPSAEASPEPTFTRTLVLLDSSGKHQIKTDIVTANEIEQMKLRRGRTASAKPAPTGYSYLLVGGDCNDDRSIWLFDQANRTGNMLCLLRSTSETLSAGDLGSFLRPPVFQRTWSAAVRSFWAGNEPGYFRMGGSFNTPEAFSVWQLADTVSTTVRDAVVLGISVAGATRSAQFIGWSLNVSSCSTAQVSVDDGVNTSIFNVSPFRINRSNGQLDCGYQWTQNMVYGRKHNTNFGSCNVAAVENSLIKPPQTWFSSSTVHFYNGSCSDVEPFHP